MIIIAVQENDIPHIQCIWRIINTVCPLNCFVVISYQLVLSISFGIISLELDQPPNCPNGMERTEHLVLGKSYQSSVPIDTFNSSVFEYFVLVTVFRE